MLTNSDSMSVRKVMRTDSFSNMPYGQIPTGSEGQSVQSNERVTAFFHMRYISSRLEESRFGSQV